jgi:hypothetical protein
VPRADTKRPPGDCPRGDGGGGESYCIDEMGWILELDAGLAAASMKQSDLLKGRFPGLGSFSSTYGLLVLVLLNPNPLASASPDPLDQWQVRVPASDGLLGCEYKSVAYGDGQWVIVGNAGAIDLNLGGGTCVSRFSGTSASLNAVTFADGLFVSVGDRRTILSSADTLTWTPHGQTGLGDLCGVTFGGGIHVAVGQRGIILISPGRRWINACGEISIQAFTSPTSLRGGLQSLV